MLRVKICGMTSREDIACCQAAGADALGFIFARGPRQLSLGAAERLTGYVAPFVTTVGVFAQNEPALIREAIDRCRLDVLQFSGNEPDDFMGSFGRPTILVIHAGADRQVNGKFTPRQVSPKRARALAVMVDGGNDVSFGGTGQRVDDDFAIAVQAKIPLPFILAGGLHADNVAAAVQAVKPWGIDARSGVERHGAKDPELVERFIQEARKAKAYAGG